MKSNKICKILSLALILAVLLASFVFPSSTVAETISEDTKIVGGMVLSKRVDATDDPNEYKITLSAYSTGEAYTIQSSVSRPVDIILVIDESGSMSDSFVRGTSRFVATQKAINSFIDSIKEDADKYNVNHRIAVTTYADDPYVYIGNKYYRGSEATSSNTLDYSRYVVVTGKTNDEYRSLANNNLLFERVNGVYYPVTVSRKWTSRPISGHYDYTYTFHDKSTVSSSGANTKPSLGTRVLYTHPYGSIIGSAFQDVTVASQLQNIRTTIGNPDKNVSSAIRPGGGTYPSGAVSFANQIFDAYADDYGTSENRGKLVVFFTDGMPGDGDTFSDKEANKTLPYFKSLKDKGADVYSVGVFSSADCSNPQTLPNNGSSVGKSSNNNKANRFMFLASSYYPDATSMTTTGSIVGNYTDRAFYMSPQNVDSLVETFSVIAQDIHTVYTEVVMTDKAMIKDVITPFFAGPTRVDEIDYYYQECKGIDQNDNRLRVFYDEHVEAKDLKVDIISYAENAHENTALVGEIPNDTVIATNFNYKENWCGLDDGNPRGKKVVLEFKVKVRDGFIGGNGVPTNQAISGLYDDDGNLLPGFDLPMPSPQDIPIEKFSIKVNAATKHVYLYGDLTKEQMAVDATIQMYNADGDPTSLLKLDKENYGLPEWRVKFIEVETEMAKAPMMNITSDDTYNIKGTITPKTSGTYDSETATSNDANVLCYVPRITFKDSSILSGKTPDYSDNIAKIEWVHKNKAGNWVTCDNMTGKEPKLSFEYSPVEGATFGDTNVKVTKVLIDSDGNGTCDTDIFDRCIFQHETCSVEDCSFDSENYNFMVHVSDQSANIIIENTGDTVDANDTFVYTITSEKSKSYKQTVVIRGKNRAVIKGVPVGKYTVTQDETWSYNYVCESDNPIVKTVIGEEADGEHNVFTFKNEKTNVNNFKEAWGYIKNVFTASGVVSSK